MSAGGPFALIKVREPPPPRTAQEKEQAKSLPRELKPAVLVGVLGIWLGSLVGTLSEQLTAQGLPDIQGALNVGPDQGQWIQTGFVMAEVGFTPLAPFFAVVLGVRRLETACLLLFALLSLLIPFAPDFGSLMAMRVLQGMASGPLVPMLLLTVIRTFPPHLRGVGVVFYALAETFNPNIAPWLAGQITLRLGWEWLFWINPPLMLVAAAAVLYGIPPAKPQWKMLDGMDTFGMATLVVGLCALVGGLAQGARYNWTDSGLVTGLLLLAAVALAVFLWHELTVERPLIEFRYLAVPNLGGTVGSLLLFTFALLGPTYVVPEFLREVAGFRPEQVGDILVWSALPQLLLAPLTVLLTRRVEVRVVIALGWALLAFSYYLGTYLTPDWRLPQFVAALAAYTVGLSAVMVSILTITTNSVSPEQAPTISALFNLLRTIGTNLGSGIIAGLVATRERIHAYYLASEPWPVPPPASGAPPSASAAAYTMAFADAFGVLGLLCVVAIFILLFLDETRVPIRPPSQ